MHDQFVYRREGYRRGQYPRGHRVRCKHCGRSLEAHRAIDLLSMSFTLWKGYSVTLWECAGYEPRNLKRWHTFERRFQQDEHSKFVIASYERQAEGEAAWAMYGARMRSQQLHADRTRLQDRIQRAGSQEDREKAVREQAAFEASVSRSANLFVVGSGAGGNILEND